MTYHKSVLLQEVIKYLDPKPGKLFIDGTLGGGGHSQKFLEAGATVLGIDRDPEAIDYVKKNLQPKFGKNLILVQENFSHIEEVALKYNMRQVDGILLDLGVSSHQIDDAKRGFSFQNDGPLDMRMDPNLQISAYDIINNFEKRRLNEILQAYGQEKFAGPIAAAICSTREVAPITSTGQLAEIIEKCVARWRYKGNKKLNFKAKINPATKTFQALRIVINSELLNLDECLPQTVKLLKPGGRLAVISFHSLEDAIVKRFFKQDWQLLSLTERPVGPSELEIRQNPRARSAKLRVAEKK